MDKFFHQKSTMDADDKNFCVPVALALVTGRTAAEVNASLMAKGHRVKGGGVRQTHWLDEIVAMGLTAHNVTKTYLPHGKVSVKRVATLLDPSRKYLVSTDGHLLAVIQGIVEDWTAQRLHRVLKIYEVLPTGESVSTHVPKPMKPARDKDAMNNFMLAVRPLVNTEDTRWRDVFHSRVTGSWVKFYQDGGGFSFLVGQVKGGKYKLALQADGSGSRYALEDTVASVAGQGNSSKSYVHWILTADEFKAAVAAIRSF
jgi:hypothetical protein